MPSSVIAIPRRIEVFSLGLPEVSPGVDLAELLVRAATLRDGDVVLMTSKVVSKAERRFTGGDRGASIAAQARRVLARRGETVIAETRHGLVMAAAGVDASNVPAGTALTLPVDPDESARRLRRRVHRIAGANVAVIITDTAGRAWRLGQTDMAIGCAGVAPMIDLRGTRDALGNLLTVTAPAVADELAAAGDLVKGKATGRPVAVVRGLVGWVLPADEHGPGAVALVRDSREDMFGLGTREAVLAAATRDDKVALAHFPPRAAVDPPPFDLLVSSHGAVRIDVMSTESTAGSTARRWRLQIDVPEDASDAALIEVGRLLERAEVLATAYRLGPATATTHADCPPGWRPAASVQWQPEDSDTRA